MTTQKPKPAAELGAQASRGCYVALRYYRRHPPRERLLHFPWNPATTLGRPGEYAIGRGVWQPRTADGPFLFAFQGWILARASRAAPSDSPEERWLTIVGVYLTTRRRLVTVVELGRDVALPPVRPLVLAADIHAGWPGARAWLGAGGRVLPRLEGVPHLREALDATLDDAVERVETWMREAGWGRDYA